MKILYLLGFLPPYVAREVEAMAARGNDISVLLPERENSSETADFWDCISKDPEGSSVSVSRKLKFRYLNCPVRELIPSFFRSLRFFKACIRSIRDSEFRYFIIACNAVFDMNPTLKPDVIHAHFADDQAHIARIISFILQIPYSVTTHATDIFVPKSRARLRRVLADAALVFTISEYNLKYLAEYDLPPGHTTVVRLGLNTDALPERKKTSGSPLIVCTASGLVQKKGVPVLIRAMHKLLEENIDCTLTVIGSDPDSSKLQEFRKAVEHLPVNFAGVLTTEDTLNLVSEAAVFVLPCIEASNGDRDGIPVALMEAMGIGVPCISTEISGIPELIENGVSGLLVTPGSSEELAAAMSSLLSDSAMADKLGAEGRRKVLTNHSPEKLAGIMTDSFVGIFKK